MKKHISVGMFAAALLLLQLTHFLEIPALTYTRILLFWVFAFYLLGHVSVSTLLFGKRQRWWDLLALAGFFMLSSLAITSSLSPAYESLLAEPSQTFRFTPADATGNLTIAAPLNGPFPAADSYARAFAPGFWFNGGIPFILVPEQVPVLLEPYGINGFLLQLTNVLNGILPILIFSGLVMLFLLAVYSFKHPLQQPSIIRTEGVTRGFFVKLFLSAFHVLFFSVLFEWYALMLLVPNVMTLFLALLLFFSIDKPLQERVRHHAKAFAKEFQQLFLSIKTVPVGIAGLLVLHILLDGFPDGEPLTFVAVCILLFLICYMWYKTFRIRQNAAEEHRHYPQLQDWLIGVCVAVLVAFGLPFLPSYFPYVVGGVLGIAAYFFARYEVVHRTLMSLLFICGLLFLGWYCYASFMLTVQELLPRGVSLLGGLAFPVGIWWLFVLLLTLVFLVVGFFSFVYELGRD